ncbi:Translation initiation factor 2 [Frankia sp. AiPs1]|uniref:hypothetical protein n=1 Tax=Frankia sp. AiPa1 TaxID=573492 RepID=UPI00202B1346|nr:hypothetical protein [Frankia sp. AiPa1]MCL9759113.1 hypothetical protein [Frankia sp. AiPa1]
MLIPSVVMLSHPEQAERLGLYCPSAVPATVLAGDPCYDRMLASVEHRGRYRRAFGLSPTQRLLVISSTWGSRSLLGTRFELVRSLLADLPVDEYRVVLALHPNIWHGHGPWQVRTWLADCTRAGLVLLPPEEGWRAALVACDAVVGDHGSVTFYGAALGRPTLLGAFPFDELDPRSPVAALGRTAPFLRANRPLTEQVDAVISGYTPNQYAAATSAVTSVPGESAQLLRTLIYDRLGLPEPASRIVVAAVPPPTLPRTALRGPTVWWAETVVRDAAVDEADGTATITLTMARRPAELSEPREHAHLAVDEATQETSALPIADVIVRHANDLADTPLEEDMSDLLDRYPGCSVVGVATASGRVRLAVRLSSGIHWYDSAETDAARPGPDLALHASALYGWLSHGQPVGARLTFHVRIGKAERTVTMRRMTKDQIVRSQQENCSG